MIFEVVPHSAEVLVFSVVAKEGRLLAAPFLMSLQVIPEALAFRFLWLCGVSGAALPVFGGF